MFDDYADLAQRALRDQAPSTEGAGWILEGGGAQLLPLLQAAFEPRRRHFGRKVMVHILNNVQNGLCPEDCGYCSQNRDSRAPIRSYSIKSDAEILREALRAAEAGASRYCMVLSGRGPTLRRVERMAALIRRIKSELPIELCLSVGLLDEEQTRLLADAGLDRVNHNLNTSERHYPNVCSTHTYADRMATLRAAKRCGLGTCSGLIVGMGERDEDLVEVAFTLRELEVPSIPVNFLIPIEGNQIQSDGSLTPERCLRVLCLMRLVNPRAEIRVAAGREGHLRSMQALALYPANSLFVDGYLTTRGDAAQATYRMIEDAGFEVEGNALYHAKRAAAAAEAGAAEPANGVEQATPARGPTRSHGGQFQIPAGGDELLKPELLRR